jgi:hypothetical protein
MPNMTDVERLRLIAELLAKAELSDAGSLGHVAAQIESLFDSIALPPNPLCKAFSELWAALEVIGVQHQEAGTAPTAAEVIDLKALATKLQAEAEAEVSRCSDQKPGDLRAQ